MRFNIFISFYTYIWTYIHHSYSIYSTMRSSFILFRLYDVAEVAMDIHFIMIAHSTVATKVPVLLECGSCRRGW
jgi:hypothetical protein